MNRPWPTCDVCKGPVQMVAAAPDQESFCATKYTVQCHGQTESFSISERDLMVADRVSIGRAFIRRGALPPVSVLPAPSDDEDWPTTQEIGGDTP